MINNNGQNKSNMVPLNGVKKKGANSNYVNSMGPITGGKQMSYAGSVSGSLQDKQALEQHSYQKSPMLNTGKKMSGTSLQGQRTYNRSSAP